MASVTSCFEIPAFVILTSFLLGDLGLAICKLLYLLKMYIQAGNIYFLAFLYLMAFINWPIIIKFNKEKYHISSLCKFRFCYSRAQRLNFLHWSKFSVHDVQSVTDTSCF